MKRQYRLSERAAQDIADIHAYSTANWGEEKADEYAQAIYLALEQLAANPNQNTSRNRRSAPFRMAAIRQYFILYEIVDDEVIVLTIMHQTRNVEKHVAKLTPGFKKLVARMKQPD